MSIDKTFRDRAKRILENKAIDGGLADATHWLTLPKSSTDNLSNLEDKEGALVYDSTAQSLVVNTGSGFVPVSSGGAVDSVNGETGVVVLDASDVNAASVNLDNLDTPIVNASINMGGNSITNLSSLGAVSGSITGGGGGNISGFGIITADNRIKGNTIYVDNTGRMEKQFSKPAGGDPDFAIFTQSITQSIGIFSNSGPSSAYVAIETGNAAAGNSGPIALTTGTASGVRGDITMLAGNVNFQQTRSINFVIQSGNTASRPATPVLGQMYFDTDLSTSGLPIWFDGTDWINAAGTVV